MLDLSNPIRPWEEERWTPEPLFKGETVFCVASGPSLTQEIADKLRDKRVIVCNSSCHFVPWADVLFFTDNGWYEQNRDIVRNWPGLVVSLSRLAKREQDDPCLHRFVPRVLRIKTVGDPTWPPRLPGMPKRLGFPPVGSLEIHQGRTSGHTIISLAIAMGANLVPLIAYDMQVVAGREHCHDEYKGQKRDVSVYPEYQQGFRGWREAALNSGVEIVNCTPGSAITEFPMADLDEVLSECTSRFKP